MSDLRPYDSHPELPLDPDVVQPGVYKWPPHFIPALQVVVFVGGSLGALTRYEISVTFEAVNDWPVATLMTNLIGAFLLGLLLESLSRRGADQGKLRFIRLGLGTGFLGAFTTYSTLAVEINLLARDGHMATAIAYALLSIIGGIVLCAFGIQAAIMRHSWRSGVKR